MDAAKAELELLHGLPGSEGRTGAGGLVERTSLAKMFAMIEEIRSLELNSHVTDGRLIVQADLSAQEGSTGKGLKVPTKGDIRSLIGLIPEKAYFASAALGVTGGLLKELGFNQAELEEVPH